MPIESQNEKEGFFLNETSSLALMGSESLARVFRRGSVKPKLLATEKQELTEMHSPVIGRHLVRGIWASKGVMLSSFTSRKARRTFHLENSTLPISKCLS